MRSITGIYGPVKKAPTERAAEMSEFIFDAEASTRVTTRQCGRSLAMATGRIIDGSAADAGEYPWMVKLSPVAENPDPNAAFPIGT